MDIVQNFLVVTLLKIYLLQQQQIFFRVNATLVECNFERKIMEFVTFHTTMVFNHLRVMQPIVATECMNLKSLSLRDSLRFSNNCNN